ncbi:hypothetical protein AW736_26025, partial [Termitidicoccus mucosus]
MNIAPHALRLTVAALLASILWTPALRAQVSGTFTGSGTNWADAANWTGGTPGSAAGDSAILNLSANPALANKTISLAGAGTGVTLGTLAVIGPNSVDPLRSLTLGATASPSLVFDSGAVGTPAALSLSGGINLRIAADITTLSDLAVSNNSAVLGKITLLGALDASGRTVTFYNDTGPADITVSGALTAASLVKNGVGKLILNGPAASIAGPVNLNAGTLVIGANNVLGSGALTLGAAASEKRLHLAGDADRSLSNSLDLSASDLIVSREDANTALTLRTLTLAPAAASLTSLGSGTRTLNVGAFTGLALGANQSFSGGTLLKQGSGVLTLGGADSTFSALDIRAGSVVGYLSASSLSLGGGTGLFGSGTIRVSGGSSVLEVRGSNPANTLDLIAGASITLSDHATFRLANATLRLLGGSIDLGADGLFDFNGNVVLGSTAISNAPASGFDFAGNVAFHDSLTGIAGNASYLINLSGTGAQTLSRVADNGAASPGTVSVSATLAKTGTGALTLDSSITQLQLANALRLDAGTLILTRAGQLYTNSDFTFTGRDTASVRLGGFDQSIGEANIASGATGVFALGGDRSTSTSLMLASIAFGDTTGILRIRDYTDGTLLDGAPDIVATALPPVGAALNQIWFHGYNKGAQIVGTNEIAPANGLLDSSWTYGAATLNWFAAANWRSANSSDIDSYNIPNSPGAIARLSDIGGALYGQRILFGSQNVTVGQLLSSSDGVAIGDSATSGGYLIFDSGVTGSAAIWGGGARSSLPRVLLKSDLIKTGYTSVYDSIGNISDDFAESGIARKIILKSGIYLNLGANNIANSFTGGVDLENTAQIRISPSANAGYTSGTWLGSGRVNILAGTASVYGQSGDTRNPAYMIRLTNELVLNGNLNTGSIIWDYAGDVDLSATRTINVAIATSSANYQNSDSAIFGKDFNFTGTGGLVFTGAYNKRLLSPDHDFTGGLSANLGTLWGDAINATGNEVTLGALDAGKNPLGPGNITVNPTGANIANIFVVNAAKTTLAGGTINLGTTANGTVGVLHGDTYLSGGVITGNGYFRTDGDLWFDGANVAAGNFSFMGDSLTKKIRSTTPGATVAVNNLLKDGAGTATIDTSITSLTAGTLTVNGGVFALGAANQLTAGALALNGGVFDTGGYTNNGIASLNLLADSSLQLGAGGGLHFNTSGTGAGWTSGASLVIQNNTGIWNDYLSGGSYVRFATDVSLLSNSLAQSLQNIAFTGYESGAQIHQDGSYYYLLPDAAPTVEWTGGAGTADTKWSTGGNWLLNGVPSGAGISVSFRDLDAGIGTKGINVDGAYTLGRLNLQATPRFTLDGSGTLIFSNTGGLNAVINSSGGSQGVTAAWRLDSDTDLNLATPRAAGQFELRNAISGAGNLDLNGANTAIIFGGTNAAWSGNLIWDTPTQRLRVTANGTPLTGSGTFLIGAPGASGDTFYIEAYGAARTVTLAGGAVLNSNLYLAQNSDGATANGGLYDLTLTGDLELGGSGTRTITVEILSESGVNSSLILNGVVSGSAGIIKQGGGWLRLNKTNTFTGDFTWTGGQVYLGADNALGTGAFRPNISTDSRNMTTVGTGVKLGNQIINSAGRTLAMSGIFYWNADSSAVGNSQLNGNLSITGGTHIFGKDHVIEGVGSLTRSTFWFLGGGNINTGNTEQTYGGVYVIGASSTKDAGGNVIKGPLGVGAYNTGGNSVTGGGLYVFNDSGTEQRLGNTIVFGSNLTRGINFLGASGALNAIVNGSATPNMATTLVLDANTLTLRAGGNASVINANAGILRIESQIKDASSSDPGIIAKGGAGTLELTNLTNEISGGIEARSGTVRYDAATHDPANDDIQIGTGATGDTAFGAGVLSTKTADGTGNAGAIEVIAAVGGTVTINGGGGVILNNNGRFIVTGSDVTTVLANGGALTSTSAAGQEGTLVAGLVQTTSYTLGVKLAAADWELGSGTVNLARADLLSGVQNLHFADGSRLNINQKTQTIAGAISVTGTAIIDVSGGTPSNPVSILTGAITVDPATGFLTFLGWDADPITGLGSTLIRTTLAEGYVIENIKLGTNAATAAVAQRNDAGIRVLLPFDQIFIWDGQAANGQWTTDNWMKQDSLHLPSTQPDAKGALVTFDTDRAALGNATITVPGARRLNNLVFTGTADEDFAIAGPGTLVFQGLTSTAEGFVTQTGVSDITIGAAIDLEYDDTASLGKNLVIEQNGAGALIFNGKIDGPDSRVTVTGTGAGAVVFNAQNTFSKAFVLESGNVWLGVDGTAGAGGPLGYGDITIKSGTLRGVNAGATIAAYADADRVLQRGYILDGSLAKAGSRALALAGGGTLASSSTVAAIDAGGTLALGTATHELALGAHTLTAAGAGVVRLDGALTGAGHLVQAGPGALVVNVASQHTGTTTVTGGTLALAAANAIASSTAVVVDGVLAATGTQTLNNLAGTAATGTISNSTLLLLNSSLATTYDGAITGAGSIEKTGAATLTLAGTNTFTGTVTVNNGLLAITGWTGTTGASGTSSINGTGSVALTGTWYAATNFIMTGTTALDISGGGRLENTVGNGTVKVGVTEGANAAVTLGGDAVWLRTANAQFDLGYGASATGSVIITGHARLLNQSPGGNWTNIGGGVNSLGTVTISGNGWWHEASNVTLGYLGDGVLNISESGSFTPAKALYLGGEPNDAPTAAASGTVNISGGLLQAAGLVEVGSHGHGALNISGSGVVRTGSHLSIGDDGTATGEVNVSGNGLLDAAGDVFTGAAGTGALTIAGSGSVTAGGAYSQNASSTLTLSYSGAPANRGAFITAASGTLDGALAVAHFTGTFSDAVLSGTKFSDMNLAGVTGTLIHATAGTLAGDFATIAGSGSSPVDYIYQGAYKSADGHDYVLAADLSWRIGGTLAHGDFTVAGGTSFDLDIALSDTTANTAQNWNGDTLTKKGAGLLILSASNAYSGTTVVGAGTLRATHLGALGSSLASVSSLASLELAGLSGTLT